MKSSRFDMALASGTLALPASGDILVLRPRIGDDLDALPRDRLRIVQGFRPDHDWFADRGHAVTPEIGTLHGTLAIVCLPRAKAEARGLIAAAAEAVAPGGMVAVDGQKTDGIDAMLRDLRHRVEVEAPLSKAHGKIFAFHAHDRVLEGWAAAPRMVEGFQTLPGLFSADGPDKGSAMLAAILPERLGPRVVDLGAGWGHLSRAILERAGVAELHLVEAEAAALDCARVNVPDARAQFHWADATTFRPDRAVDTVVCNPPFHTAREPDPGLGAAFLATAARILAPHGVLWLVANRHLPYDAPLGSLFHTVEEVGGDATFRLIRASRPVRAPR